MDRMRSGKVDDVGDLDAPPGSREWSIAIRMRMSAALKDERSSAKSLERWKGLFIEHQGYRALADANGEQFPTFEAFCRAPSPHGLGYDADAIDAIIEERRTAQARAQAPKTLRSQGRPTNGEKVRTEPLSKRGESADYLTARIARDRTDILTRMQAGEFLSVAAAARAAGIQTGERKSVRIDDPDKVAAFLAKHFDPAEIRAIADLAIHIRGGG